MYRIQYINYVFPMKIVDFTRTARHLNNCKIVFAIHYLKLYQKMGIIFILHHSEMSFHVASVYHGSYLESLYHV